MQKWCPEPLVVDHERDGGFVPLNHATPTTPADAPAGFRPEAGFADAEGLLAALSREERGQIIELIEGDLRREFEQRHGEENAAREAALAERLAAEAATRERWQDEFARGLRDEVETALGGLARHTVEIASLMAEKIVRREVAGDPDVLVRALETVLYKVEAGCSLQVTAHPDDAAWLRGQPETCARLRVTEIKEDRRLERGGVLVRAADQEWDATIARQLAVLAETLEEALALPASPAPGEAPDA